MPATNRQRRWTVSATATAFSTLTFSDSTGTNATQIMVDITPIPRTLAQVSSAIAGEVSFWFGANRTAAVQFTPSTPDAFASGKQVDITFQGTAWAGTNVADLTAVLDSDGDVTFYPTITTVQVGSSGDTPRRSAIGLGIGLGLGY